jgi:hypothetical protein
MRLSIDFVYRPNWSMHGTRMGFGPNGLLGKAQVEVPEVDLDDAPVRFTVQGPDERLHVLRERRGTWYEACPKVPQGLGLAALVEMDFRPRKAWDGSWELGFDKTLPLARVESRRLECLSKATPRTSVGNPFMIASGDHRECESAAADAFVQSGITLVGGDICRKVPVPVLVLTAYPGGHASLAVSLAGAKASPTQTIHPIDDYAGAVEALRAAGGTAPRRPLVVEHESPSPAPGPR